VEGEGGVLIRVKAGTVEKVQLRIYEPPRFFEAFLRGRSFEEAPDITARICGICPVAYQMSAVHAIESAFGINVDAGVRGLRRLLYCGEWIESHALHIYLLHAPDFFGADDALQLAKKDPELLRRGLRLKKIGNEIVRRIGGREIHPINARVGGFYKAPDQRELTALKEDLLWARGAAVDTIRWTAGFSFPNFERPYNFVALRHSSDYPMNEGRIVSSSGLEVSASQFEKTFPQDHREHSNALFSKLHGTESYCVGPLARYNLNFDRLSPLAQDVAREAGLTAQCRNPFRSIVVRGVELLYACEEALRLVDAYEPPPRPSVEITPKAGTGSWCTEAPRGILFHRYVLDDRGMILEANIMPPTAQNQDSITEDLREYVTQHYEKPSPQLTRECEQAVRNYDPCISCATHFVTLDIDRAGN